MNTPRRVLVAAAHPDDEILGCGGTLAAHAAAGAEVHVLIVAEGATARERKGAAGSRTGEVEALRASARLAAQTIGAQTPLFLGLPDNRLDSLPLLDIIKPIEDALAEIGPAILYTHHFGELNVDHCLVHRAVATACRPLPNSTVRRILAFETPSATEWMSPGAGAAFQPNWFVDISRTLDRKMEALRHYESEMRPFPHARSREGVKALATLRGAQAGVSAAESFMLVREIR